VWASTDSAGSAGTSSAPCKHPGADLDIVAANDLGDVATMAHLLKYDSILGRYPEPVRTTQEASRLAIAR
jgi:glyceraldehyde-3-phosphate dehydrogenase/erythrose-4-phosphate dehydrogenase